MMNKVKIFSAFNSDYDYLARRELENDINCFGEEHEIISVSICSEEAGRRNHYIAAVTYKDKN